MYGFDLAMERVCVPCYLLGINDQYTKMNPAFNSAYICRCCSVAQLYLILCNSMDYSTPVLHYLLGFAQTHVHWVDDAIQASHPLLSPSPNALHLSQHQGLFQWVSCSHQVAKVLELQLPQHQSFQWTIQGWLPLGWLTKALLPLLWRTLRVPMGTTAQTMDHTRQPWGPQHLCHCKSTSPVFALPLGCGSFLRPQVPYTLDWATKCPEFLFYFHISHTSKGDEMAWNFYHKFQTASNISLFYSPHINPLSAPNIGPTRIYSLNFLNKLLFIYLAVPGLRWGMWDLVSWPGIEPRPPALGAQS